MKSNPRIIVTGPRFKRSSNDPPPACAPIDWETLRTMDIVALKELGLRPFNEPDDPEDGELFDGKTLMLLPGEWYRDIPVDFVIVDIMGRREKFKPDVTDNDIRMGCLAYGVLR